MTLVFMEPALPDDLDVYSWPLSYITWYVRSCDGGQHKVEIYDSTSSQLGRQQPGRACRMVAANGRRPDAPARGHAGPAGARLLRRRPPHQLGLCLRRRAQRTFPRGDRRCCRAGNVVCRQGRPAGCRRHTHAPRGPTMPSPYWPSPSTWAASARAVRPAAGDRGLRRDLRHQVLRQAAAPLLGAQRTEDRRTPANRLARL